jgi:hypothetical protein
MASDHLIVANVDGLVGDRGEREPHPRGRAAFEAASEQYPLEGRSKARAQLTDKLLRISHTWWLPLWRRLLRGCRRLGLAISDPASFGRWILRRISCRGLRGLRGMRSLEIIFESPWNCLREPRRRLDEFILYSVLSWRQQNHATYIVSFTALPHLIWKQDLHLENDAKAIPKSIRPVGRGVSVSDCDRLLRCVNAWDKGPVAAHEIFIHCVSSEQGLGILQIISKTPRYVSGWMNWLRR